MSGLTPWGMGRGDYLDWCALIFSVSVCRVFALSGIVQSFVLYRNALVSILPNSGIK